MGLELPCVLVLSLLVLARGSESGDAVKEPEVHPPTNVTIESYNFNISLRWDYNSVSSKPLFTVEILCYGRESVEVSTCVNISHHYCDLTHNVNETCKRFWARVKAVAGSQESKYAVSEMHDLIRDGRLGPPKLNLSLQDDKINVYIEHPLTPYRKKSQLSVRANITDLTYKVFLWKSGSAEKRENHSGEDCDRRRCVISLPLPSLDFEYCVSAQGISEDYFMTGEESKESCVVISRKHPLDLRMPIAVGVLAIVATAVILVFVLMRMYLKKRNVQLPKSLVAVVRNISHSSTFETKAEGKYNSSVRVYKPVLPQCEDGKSAEEIDPVTEVKPIDLGDSCKEDLQGTSSKASEMSIQESSSVEIPESLDSNVNYFKSTSGQEDMGSSISNLDLPRAHVQQLTDLGSCRKVSGYDKPHWLDSDSHGEQSLIG